MLDGFPLSSRIGDRSAWRRTLMSEPRMLLVDEPTAGLRKMLAQEAYQMLTDLSRRDGLTILLVDQEIRHALKIADYVYVLELGRNKFEGPAEEHLETLEHVEVPPLADVIALYEALAVAAGGR